MAVVDTVAGPREAADLGRVLMHEHLFVLTLDVEADYPDLAWNGRKADRVQEVVHKLQAVKERGIGTIVDLTVLGIGRCIPNVQEVLTLVDINVVVATGIYTYDHLGFFFESRPPTAGGKDVLTDMFVRDITTGIGDTGVRAGILKCCTDKPGITPNIERVLRATARAHLTTGVPITTHSDAASRSGLEQQRIFREEGVDLTRVVIGHSGDTADLDYLRRMMDAGSTIGCDRFGIYRDGMLTFEQRVDTVARLCAEGYADRIVLSHDAMCHEDARPPLADGGARHCGLLHLSDDVLPALELRGVSAAQIELMLVDNPARLLPTRDPQGPAGQSP